MGPRVLIMSSERSGSNLLRTMLGRHPQLSAPPAVHFTTAFAELLHLYPDLHRVDRRAELARDAIAIARGHVAGWTVPLDAEAAAREAVHPSLWGVVDQLLQQHAEADGRAGWVCKDNDLFHHAVGIATALPDVRVLYLVRDGRDVAASVFRVPFGPKHVDPAARQWRREQIACLRVEQLLGGHRVRYEDLVADPEGTLTAVCAHLGLAYDPRMLEADDRSAAQATRSVYWANLGQKVTSSRSGRYRDDLTPAQVRRYEAIAGPELATLGYPLDHPPTVAPTPIWQQWWFRLVSAGRGAWARHTAPDVADRRPEQELRTRLARRLAERAVTR